jgi:hypothetical protein
VDASPWLLFTRMTWRPSADDLGDAEAIVAEHTPAPFSLGDAMSGCAPTLPMRRVELVFKAY